MSILPGYTRVTEVLNPFSGLKDVNPIILARACERGTKVHEACEAIVTGADFFPVEEKIAGYVKSFRKWWDLGHKVVEVEKRFYDQAWMLTGAVDLILEVPGGGHVIVDLKTPAKESKTWALQGTAYALMAERAGYRVVGVQFLQLRKDGSDPILFEYDIDVTTWMGVFATYKYFYQGNNDE